MMLLCLMVIPFILRKKNKLDIKHSHKTSLHIETGFMMIRDCLGLIGMMVMVLLMMIMLMMMMMMVMVLLVMMIKFFTRWCKAPLTSP